MNGFGRNDAASSAAQSGIPTQFHRANQIPTTSKRVRLPGGVEVDQVRYERFEDALSGFARDIATSPHHVPMKVGGLADKLMTMHMAEMSAHTEAMARHYDSPHQQRWEQHRSKLRAQTMATKSIDIQKSRACVDAVFGGDKRAKEAFLDMAEETGAGDHPIMHVFLNRAHGLLSGKGPGVGLYGGGSANVSPTLSRTAPQAPAFKPPTSAPVRKNAVSTARKLYGD